MGVGPLTINSVRSNAVDFTTPFMNDGMSVLIPRPEQSFNLFRSLSPFHWTTWLLICACLFLASAIAWLCSWLSPFSAWNRDVPFAITDEISVVENMWSGLGSITLQGNDFYPLCFSARTVVTIWWTFSVIVQNTYQSDLTAFLTTTIYEPSIEDISDFYTTNYLKPIILTGSNGLTLFRTAQEGTVYANVWNVLKDQPKVSSTEEAVELVASTKEYGFISDLSTLRFYTDRNCSVFNLAKQVFNVASFGFAIPKGAIYTKAMNF
ncbi:hypothetical protein Ciccas_007756 [Cichlidogyrus casuarinus]|uniref:PBPe domain-containing protein n=1 Tax=Cichlidogyrus casuarinus TaxID=1844966 RepID=A0ABD2Q260_9PLAT